MARGDFFLFNAFVSQLGDKKHGLKTGGDVIKLGIIDNTLVPVASQVDPKWSTYSVNEVSEAGGYVVDGLTILNQSYDEIGGVGVFDGDNFALAHNPAGFTNGYYGVLYNSTNIDKVAIGVVDLGGPVSEVEGPVIINWNELGIFKVSVVTE